MSNKTNAKPTEAMPRSGAPRFIAKAKTGGEVRPDKQNPIVLKQSQDVGECLVIAVVPVSGFTEQFTIHRPIGVTDLDADEWVVTPTSEVHQLIARAKDPAQAKNDEIRRTNERSFLIAYGLLTLRDGKVFYPGVDEKTRRDLLDEAEKAMKAARKTDKSAKQSVSQYLVGQAKEGELKIIEARKSDEFKRAVENGVDRSYRTRGGVLENKTQVGAPGLKGKSMRELPTFIAKVVMQTLGLGEQMVVTVAPSKAPDPSEEVNEALEEQIERLQDELQGWNASYDALQPMVTSMNEVLCELKKHLEGDPPALSSAMHLLATATELSDLIARGLRGD